jgi:DNA-binding IclR family transcriptional regulator
VEIKGTKGKSKAAHIISDILFCFKDGSGILGVTEIAKKLGVYTSKIHRVVSTLTEQGLLEQNPITKKYKIGLKLFEIGSLYPLNLNVRRIAYPHALTIAKMFETNVHLGILSKSIPYSLVVIERVINLQSSDSIRRISFNIPLHSSAMGKVFLAFLDKKTASSIIQNIKLERYTTNTITNKSHFEKELKLIRSQGYGMDKGETHTNLYCIAAPIKDKNGIAAAISVSDVRQKITKRQDEIVRNIIETADFISYQMGD